MSSSHKKKTKKKGRDNKTKKDKERSRSRDAKDKKEKKKEKDRSREREKNPRHKKRAAGTKGAKESSEEQDEASSAASLKLPVKKDARREPPAKAASLDKLHKKQAKQFDKNIEFRVTTFLDGQPAVKRLVYGDKETYEEFVQAVHKESLINTLRTALKENGIGNNAGKTKEAEIKAFMNFKLSETLRTMSEQIRVAISLQISWRLGSSYRGSCMNALRNGGLQLAF